LKIDLLNLNNEAVNSSAKKLSLEEIEALKPTIKDYGSKF